MRKDKAANIELDVNRPEAADRLAHPVGVDRPAPAHLRSRKGFHPVGADRPVEILPTLLRLLPAVVGRLVDLLVSSWGFSFVG